MLLRDEFAPALAGLQALQGVDQGPARADVELGLLSVLGPTTMVLMGPGSAQFGEVQKRAYALCQALPDTDIYVQHEV